MSKLSKHNDGSKFIMVVIDILSNYSWLEPIKPKHGTLHKSFTCIMKRSGPKIDP